MQECRKVSRPTLYERMDQRTIVDETGCWLWIGTLSASGYGVLATGKRQHKAHRVSYERHVGPIPDGLGLDHLCRVRNCINPAHLEPVTTRVNVLRGTSFAAVNAVKTHCAQGHEFAGANLRHYRGERICRACQVAANGRWRVKRRAAQ
jgi:hypothetical protein